MFAAVISAASIAKVPSDMEILHMTSSKGDAIDSQASTAASPTPRAASSVGDAPPSTITAADEVATFFPDMSTGKYTKGTMEEPQTQMQIEQQKEKSV